MVNDDDVQRRVAQMKPSSFIDKAQALVIALGMACVASFGANAAQAAPLKIDPKIQAQSMTDAPSIIATAKINCDPSNAYRLGDTKGLKNGVETKASLYEIACKAGPGFIITAFSPTDVYQPFTCTLAAKIQKNKADSILCELPENQPHFKWLAPVVQPYLPGCDVSDARVIGSTSAAPLIDRYEVGCKSALGGIIDYPQLGSSAPIEFKPCIQMEGGNSACTFTTKDQMAAAVKPLATAADSKCVVNNTRFVGITKESDGYYYEFGCSNQPGFIALSDLKGAFERVVPCASAAGLGGCSFTDAGTASAGANATFSKQLGDEGIPCTVATYNVLGTQVETKRDYIEFKCPEQPWGVIGFVPQAGSTSFVNVNDCFIDQTKRKLCTYVTPAALMAQLDKLIKLKEPTKGCDVKEVRYIGESSGVDSGVIAELACTNKRGYIVVVQKDRNSIVEDTPCKIAREHKDPEQCTIPGNGTYQE